MARKKLSTADIAKKANVSLTLIRGAKNNYLQNVSYDKVGVMIKNLLGLENHSPRDIRNISKLKTKEEKEDFLDKFSHLSEYEKTKINLEVILDNYRKMKIFLAVHSGKPIARSVIVSKLGEKSGEDLNTLIDDGVIEEEDGVIKPCHAQYTLLSKRLAIKLTQLGAMEFSEPAFRRGENWHSYQTARVNKEFIELWRKKQQEMFNEFLELSKNEKFHGDHYTYFTQISDEYLNTKDSQKGGVQ